MAAHRYESRSLFERNKQRDRTEGVTAFLEKRSVAFPDSVPADLPNIWEDWTAPKYS
jgi:hypothetical protein